MDRVLIVEHEEPVARCDSRLPGRGGRSPVEPFAQVTRALEQLEVNAMSVAMLLAQVQTCGDSALEHVRRVSRLSVDLALVLEIQEPHVSDIERAALLHEVAQPALDIVMRNVPFLAGAAVIAAAAREPASGAALPGTAAADVRAMGAAIVALACAYDKLVSGSGCAPVSLKRALEILSVNRAAEFDPTVLAALKMLRACIRRAPESFSHSLSPCPPRRSPHSGGPPANVLDR